jgi:hypothetical protein
MFRAGARGETINENEQHGMVKRLAVFAQQEQCAVSAVVIGRENPGRHAPSGITVHYVPGAGDLAPAIARLIGKAGRAADVVVVTANAEVQARVAETGAGLMKPATLNKALGQGQSGGGNGSPPPQHHEPPKHHHPQPPKPKPVLDEMSPAKPDKEKQKEHDAVLDLIDPL